MGVNKLIIGDETVLDISKDTVNESSLLKGVTAHNSNGEKITGTLSQSESPFDDYLGEPVSTDINHQTNTIVQRMTEGTVTTTFKKQNGVNTITSKIVPKTGNLNYTRTTTIKKVNQVTQIREKLVSSNK